MSLISAVLLALLVPAAAPADPPPDTKTELAKWQGTWEVELYLADGKEKPPKEQTTAKIVVKDDVWELHSKDGAEPVRGKMKLVLDGNPKGLDVTVDKAVFRSIYLMDGDRVVVRVGDANDPRPKDFSTSIGSKNGAIIIYKRAKK